MKKKLLTLTAAVLLATGVLGGCSGSGEPAADPGPGASAAPAGPVKFSISMRTLANQHVEGSPNINEDKWVKKLEELTNTDLDIRLVPHKDFEQKMTQMFAINDVPDVVQSYSPVDKAMAGSVEAGIFLPLDDLLKQYGQNLLKKIPKAAWDEVTVGGKIMSVPEWLEVSNRRGTYIRMDLLEQTGLPVPKSVEEYLNVMRAFKKLGVENPYGGRENFSYSDAFFGAYDVNPAQFEKQGDQIIPKYANIERMTKALETYKTMFDEGLISKEFATTSGTTWQNNIFAGKTGIWSMNVASFETTVAKIKENVPAAKVAIIPSPTGLDGKGGNALYGSMVRSYFINKKAADPAAIIKFFDWMVSDEAEKFFTFGVENETYKVEGGAIKYERPTAAAAINEEAFRSDWLWMVKDTTYNKGLTSMTEGGKQLIDYIQNVIVKEGRDGYRFYPPLQSYTDYPDAASGGFLNSVLDKYLFGIIYGKEPLSSWPKAIEEWKSKGGNAIIKDATDRVKSGDGFRTPRM